MSLSFYLPFNLLCRVTRHSFLFGRFLPLSGETVGSSDEFSALPPNEFVSLWAGRKLAEEQRWLRALPSAREEEVSGWWWCGEGAMVVIAFSTCLNSSHIHLGPSFTLNCFSAPESLKTWGEKNSANCSFIATVQFSWSSRGDDHRSPPQIVFASASWLSTIIGNLTST